MSNDTLLYGKYDRLGDLGTGGQAKVIKVRHHNYGYVRALSLGDSGITKTNDEWKRFEDRCARLLRLCNGNHPNIVHCYNPDWYAGQAFFEMDFIDGDNLVEYLEKNNFFIPIEEVLQMAVQISSALSFCHYDTYEYSMNPDTDIDPVTGECLVKVDEDDTNKLVPINEDARSKLVENHRVIHNDISSFNIMRRDNGSYILIDFGLSVEGNEKIGALSMRNKEGHPEYKAPERWSGAKPSTQSDIYSFGVVLYQYLTGRAPFPMPAKKNYDSDDYTVVADAHRKEEVPDLLKEREKSFKNKYPDKQYQKERGLDWLAEVVSICLKKDPGSRFENGKALHKYIADKLKENSTDTSVYKEEELKRLKIENVELNSENQKLVSETQKIKGDYDSLINRLNDLRFCVHCGIKADSPEARFCRVCGKEFK